MCRLIAEGLERIARRLAGENYLRGPIREKFANHAADRMVDLNAVHPFREGNGRTLRVFREALTREAGRKLDFSVVSRERMIQASIPGNENGDQTMIRRLFTEISDPERVAALRNAIGALEQHGFPWNDRYIATAERQGGCALGRSCGRSVHGPHTHHDFGGNRLAASPR